MRYFFLALAIITVMAALGGISGYCERGWPGFWHDFWWLWLFCYLWIAWYLFIGGVADGGWVWAVLFIALTWPFFGLYLVWEEWKERA